jgi:thiamine-monophosphate kinase
VPSPDLGEFELIRRFFSRPTALSRGASGVVVGIGDDAAVLEVPAGAELIAAVDTIVAGRHFPEGSDARSVGHRALAVNLSDMAAMGATPAWATLALSMPSVDIAWLERFSAGLLDLADANAVALVGGDTTRGPLTVSVQILGLVARGTALLRSGARPGDLIAVTGTLGDAGAGLAFSTAAAATAATATATGVAGDAAASCNAVAELIRRFEFPAPRVQMGIAARGIASAAMDISDGLAGDLPKLAQASGLSAQVAVEKLPLSAAMRAAVGEAQARDWALSAGDDYELLFTVSPPRYVALQAAADQLNLTLTTIGEMRAGAGVVWSLHGKKFSPSSPGFDHFSRASTQITV